MQGAGTVGHLIHAFWPERKMVGWELDGELLPVVRAHMGLQQLEDCGALVGTAPSHLGCSAAENIHFAEMEVRPDDSVMAVKDKYCAWYCATSCLFHACQCLSTKQGFFILACEYLATTKIQNSRQVLMRCINALHCCLP